MFSYNPIVLCRYFFDTVIFPVRRMDIAIIFPFLVSYNGLNFGMFSSNSRRFKVVYVGTSLDLPYANHSNDLMTPFWSTSLSL